MAHLVNPNRKKVDLQHRWPWLPRGWWLLSSNVHVFHSLMQLRLLLLLSWWWRCLKALTRWRRKALIRRLTLSRWRRKLTSWRWGSESLTRWGRKATHGWWISTVNATGECNREQGRRWLFHSLAVRGTLDPREMTFNSLVCWARESTVQK